MIRRRTHSAIALGLALVLALLTSRAGAYEPPLDEPADSGHSDTRDRTEASIGLRFDPPHAPQAVFALMSDLRDEDLAARITAALALRELGELAFPALPLLEAMLEDPAMGARKAAVGALGGMGPAAEAAVPALARRLEDPHPFVRSWAAMALSEIGPGARPATAALIAMLGRDADNLRGRAWCTAALPLVKAPAADAVPALIRALDRDPSEEVRAVAVLSLERYAREAAAHGALPTLLDALNDGHWKVRGNAACALTELVSAPDPEAERIVFPLTDRLRDESAYVRGCALRSLGRLGENARRVRRDIESLRDDDDPVVRSRAEEALSALSALSALPTLPGLQAVEP